MTAPVNRTRQVLSRDAGGGQYRWHVQGSCLNAWCAVPGSPLEELRLLPNSPESGQVHLQYEPVELPDVDTVTLFLRCDAPAPTNNLLAVEVTLHFRSGDSRSVRTALGYGEQRVVTLAVDHRHGMDLRLGLAVTFERFVDPLMYGHMELRYLVGYWQNPLNDLFNAFGTDKGTEVTVGDGPPHCYAMVYHPLFESLQDQAFNLLEIGLQSASRVEGDPSDAPSLRAWREYFPHAFIYGYDINDFEFFDQKNTRTFQGDQSSRHDLRRFLDACPKTRFRVVLDDGSHASSHQQVSLATLFPRVAPGGIYVIEDLHWQPFAEAVTTIDVLRSFADTGLFQSPFLSDDERHRLEAQIDEVEIMKPNDAELAVIRKRRDLDG